MQVNQFNSIQFSSMQVNSMQSIIGYWGTVGQLLLLSARTYPFRFWLLWAADSFVGPDKVVRRRRLGS